MAEIFLAREGSEAQGGSRLAVVKVVRGEHSENESFAEMFLNEGRLAMRLSHPNICTVYECGRHQGRFFMAMEYVHGVTLRELLVRLAKRGKSLPIPEILKIFALVAEALDFAHQARDSRGRSMNIVHRDVSPHNVMIRYDGVVKLLDFGVAKAEDNNATQSGAMKGKFSYMSPEQALSQPIDHRADIFALGICLFETVTGKRLFYRKGQYEMLKAILEQEPPSLAELRDDVPEPLEEIVRAALAKDRDERFQRAADMQHALEVLLADLHEVVSTARLASLMHELFREEIAEGPSLERDEEIAARFEAEEASHATPTPAPSRRGLWLLGGGLALALVLALAFGIGSVGGTPDLPPNEGAAATQAIAPDDFPTIPAEARASEEANEAVTTTAVASDADPNEEARDEAPAGDNLAASAESPSAEAEDSGSEVTPSEPARPRPRRTQGPRSNRGSVIVADPGF